MPPTGPPRRARRRPRPAAPWPPCLKTKRRGLALLFLDRAEQLLDVLAPGLFLWLVGAQHVQVARALHDLIGQLAQAHPAGLLAELLDQVDKGLQLAPRSRRQELFIVEGVLDRLPQRDPGASYRPLLT